MQQDSRSDHSAAYARETAARNEIIGLREEINKIRQEHARMVDRLNHLDECVDNTTSKVSTLSERLFGSPDGPGEIYKLQTTLRNYIYLLAGAGAVIQFLFGSGTLSLAAILGKK